MLLTGPETIGYAAVVTARAAISRDRRDGGARHIPRRSTRRSRCASGIEALRDLLAGSQRIAVIGMDAVAHPVWQRLIEPLAAGGRP